MASIVAAASPAWPWPVTLHGDFNWGDRMHATAIDSVGNVIVAGSVLNYSTSSDFFVAKLSAGTGAELWRYEESSPGYDADEALAVTVDANDDVLAAGRVLSPEGISSRPRFSIRKLASGDGGLLWSHDETYGSCGAIVANANGDAVAVGQRRDEDDPRDEDDLRMVKVAGADGAVLWTKGFEWEGMESGAGSIAVDSAGDILAGGAVDPPFDPDLPYGDASLAVLKVAGDTGTELWRQLITGPEPYDYVEALALDAANDVVVVGLLDPPGPAVDFALVKFAGDDGHEIWRVQLNPNGDEWNYAAGVRVDGGGDVIAAGTLGAKFAVIKRAGTDGAEIWTTFLPTAFDGYASAVVLGPGDDVFVSGYLDGRFVVAKLANTSGEVLWLRSLPDGLAMDVAVDASGAVAAAGYLQKPSTYDYTLGAWKLDADGGTVGCGNGVVDVGEQCDDGNVTSGDGCGSDCTHDVCIGGTSIVGASLTIKNLAGALGDERIRLRGKLAFASGSPAVFDPAVKGAQIVVEDLGQNAARVYEMSARTTPIAGSAAGACDERDGWSITGDGGAKYRNKSRQLDPPACPPGSARGVQTLRFKDQRSTAGRIDFKLGTRGTGDALPNPVTIPVPLGPVRVTVVVSGELEDGQNGACGTKTFTAEQCTLSGTSYTCR